MTQIRHVHPLLENPQYTARTEVGHMEQRYVENVGRSDEEEEHEKGIREFWMLEMLKFIFQISVQ